MKKQTCTDFFLGGAGGRGGEECLKKEIENGQFGFEIGYRAALPLKTLSTASLGVCLVCCGCKDKGTYLFCKKSVFFLNYDLNKKQETLIRIPATKLKSPHCLKN